MNILVTGANGLIGKEISNFLENKYNVIRSDITDDYEYLDVTNEKSVEKFFKNRKIDAVVHSAYPRTENWGLDFFDVTYGIQQSQQGNAFPSNGILLFDERNSETPSFERWSYLSFTYLYRTADLSGKP